MVVPFNKTNLFLVWDGSGITVVTATKNTRDGLKTLETAKLTSCFDGWYNCSNYMFPDQ
ncbi:Pectinesterase [Vigna unguiculata]|uniref:Pectinesterase n=1 Tax=Vigna unguiculata TaxID=3917 RepID=A0A4D6MR36_VIGUN|nr:Pectinesterase [Vigna unguiculata]